MPHLDVFQSLWAMERRRPDGLEWSLEEKFAMVAEAGYDGLNINAGGSVSAPVEETKALFKRYGLACSITAFPHRVEDLDPVVAMATELDSRLVTINARYLPSRPEDGVDFVRRCLDRFAGSGCPAHFETHRYTLTNDLLFTIDLLDLVAEMELVADLSHFVVGREFPWPVDQFHLDLIDRVLRRSAGLQGRVASREQIQVQLDFPQHRGWVELFYGWWEAGMRYWLAKADDAAGLNFLCELGPPPYAITGADGYELSDRWAEALTLKDRIRGLWDRVRLEEA